MKLENKLAIVTGGARGIGKKICEAFLKEGGSVAIFDINEEEGKKTAEKYFDNKSQTGRILDFINEL